MINQKPSLVTANARSKVGRMHIALQDKCNSVANLLQFTQTYLLTFIMICNILQNINDFVRKIAFLDCYEIRNCPIITTKYNIHVEFALDEYFIIPDIERICLTTCLGYTKNISSNFPSTDFLCLDIILMALIVRGKS
jgi:hypothetical protein